MISEEHLYIDLPVIRKFDKYFSAIVGIIESQIKNVFESLSANPLTKKEFVSVGTDYVYRVSTCYFLPCLRRNGEAWFIQSSTEDSCLTSAFGVWIASNQPHQESS